MRFRCIERHKHQNCTLPFGRQHCDWSGITMHIYNSITCAIVHHDAWGYHYIQQRNGEEQTPNCIRHHINLGTAHRNKTWTIFNELDFLFPKKPANMKIRLSWERASNSLLTPTTDRAMPTLLGILHNAFLHQKLKMWGKPCVIKVPGQGSRLLQLPGTIPLSWEWLHGPAKKTNRNNSALYPYRITHHQRTRTSWLSCCSTLKGWVKRLKLSLLWNQQCSVNVGKYFNKLSHPFIQWISQ